MTTIIFFYQYDDDDDDDDDDDADDTHDNDEGVDVWRTQFLLMWTFRGYWLVFARSLPHFFGIIYPFWSILGQIWVIA